MYALRKAWNAIKDEVAPWWPKCSKEAFASGLERLAAALKNWSDSKKGKRKGRKMGFPSFRSKRRSVLSVRFTTGAIRLDGPRHVVLPRLGRIKTHEPTRKLARHIQAGTATIASATVRKQAGRWFVSFTVHLQRAQKTPARPEAVVGVDLGVATLAVFSDDRPRSPTPAIWRTRGRGCAACRAR
jgi:transposase